MTNEQKLGALGIAGPIIFIIGIIIAGTQYDGYSHISREISQLGGAESQYPWIQNLNFYLLSLCTIGFAFGIHKSIDGGAGSVIGPVLIGILGFSSAGLNAIFPCDALCEGITAGGKLHLITGVLGFLSMAIGLIVISRRMSRSPEWKTYSRYTLASGILAFILFFAAGAVGSDDASTLDGLMQRIFVSNYLVWLIVTGIRIVRNPELTSSD
ncbi:DUF998 domain-containing protein [Candidatus Lucifugimonas marina]|uniref:DUF998 domain-containing protein n=1 Tax=Candidatus Lucifugimonas marina TaxID=3038979 RepID=A0AAJ5ZL16_9CHLR|nr:DUF998 domain-containing protein [SAR202 cluster bacterium JH702]MDG0869255.1 DUF998 domain-containing protein [SAR202 cluster bacterium JH639]WFG36658.1 DUF998 domain-containing protein [SAR202 cluster bacterium JH545]WFG40592.1 DUF998 domain-containing protein [SAR202 cluster bacterium JH1073]